MKLNVKLTKARKALAEAGISHREYANANGLDYILFRKFITGKTSGMRGKTRKIAITLGVINDINPKGFQPVNPNE